MLSRRRRRHRVDLSRLRERIANILPLLEAAHDPPTLREKRGRCSPSGQLRIRHRRDGCIDVAAKRARPILLSARASAGLIKHGDGEID